MNSWSVIEGDCREVLRTLDAGSAQTCVTSPPYFGLRDYGHDGQIGLEPTPDEFVAALVDVFREVRRVLRDDGTVWLNLGDSYASQGGPEPAQTKWQVQGASDGQNGGLSRVPPPGVKPKDLIGIPWMVAFALRADGWWLRDEIIWHKPSVMPSSARDRCCRNHEQIFMLSKSARYAYDQDAIKEPAQDWGSRERSGPLHDGSAYPPGINGQSGLRRMDYAEDGRVKRSVWTVTNQPFSGAHFATFPAKLIEPCVLAGAPTGGTVLDPFNGAGTTGMVALRHNRSYVGIELNPEYADLARNRIRDDAPLLNTFAEAA